MAWSKGTGYFPSNLRRRLSNIGRFYCSKWKQSRVYKRLERKLQPFQSLKFSMLVYIWSAVVVLLVNIVWILWAKTRYRTISEVSGAGDAEIFSGSCDQANKIDTYLHLLINILSTILLSGSNFFLSTYCSPSRKEVDCAHEQGCWVRIGVYSIGNFLHISKLKGVVCFLLLITSVPFNLLYNSLIFTSTSATNYHWAVVTPQFLENNSTFPGQLSDMQQHAVNYTRLSSVDCTRAYWNKIQTSRRNLILVSPDVGEVGPILLQGSVSIAAHLSHPSHWMCPYNLTYFEVPAGSIDGHVQPFKNSANHVNHRLFASKPYKSCHHPLLFDEDYVNIRGWSILYCLSEPVESFCSVRFSWAIMIAVLISNFVKLALLTLIFTRINVEKPLLTIGDAMASFLVLEDPCTLEWRLMDKTVKPPWIPTISSNSLLPAKFASTCYRGKAASSQQWFWVVTVILLGVGVSILALVYCLARLSRTNLSPSEIGFGTPTLQALLFQPGSIGHSLSAMLIANTPQLVLSTIYIMYQNMLTSFFIADEWDAFALKKNALMVSSPIGEQKGAYFFGIPFLPGIFVQIFQVVYHWAVSQAIFPLRIEILKDQGKPLSVEAAGRKTVVQSCGYSVQAIGACLALSILLLTTIIYFGTRKLKGDDRHSIVGTCSLLISAACHRRVGTEDAKTMILKKLRWVATSSVGDGISVGGFISADEWHETHKDSDKMVGLDGKSCNYLTKQ